MWLTDFRFPFCNIKRNVSSLTFWDINGYHWYPTNQCIQTYMGIIHQFNFFTNVCVPWIVKTGPNTIVWLWYNYAFTETVAQYTDATVLLDLKDIRYMKMPLMITHGWYIFTVACTYLKTYCYKPLSFCKRCSDTFCSILRWFLKGVIHGYIIRQKLCVLGKVFTNMLTAIKLQYDIWVFN